MENLQQAENHKKQCFVTAKLYSKFQKMNVSAGFYQRFCIFPPGVLHL